MMKMQVGELNIRLWFSYPKNSAVTMCHLVVNNEIQHNGYALCTDKHFVKEVGRKLSLRRALELSGFDRDKRRQVWSSYFNRIGV